MNNTLKRKINSWRNRAQDVAKPHFSTEPDCSRRLTSLVAYVFPGRHLCSNAHFSFDIPLFTIHLQFRSHIYPIRELSLWSEVGNSSGGDFCLLLSSYFTHKPRRHGRSPAADSYSPYLTSTYGTPLYIKTSSQGAVTMAPPHNIIQEIFSTIAAHESRSPGSIASTSTYRFATHPNPDLSLALWSVAPELSPGDAFRRLVLPLRTATTSSIIGPNRAIVRFMPNEIAFGNPSWSKWIGKSVLSKVCRDLGLDAKESPGGETLAELKELLIIKDDGVVAAEWRSVWL